jgi:hypothetical protein
MDNNKIFLKEFSKILATYTRGWLDAKDWRKVLRVLPEAIGKELLKDNIVLLPFGKFSRIENPTTLIEKSINGKKNVPIINKYRATCSCSRHFKEIINGGKK